EVAPLSAIVVDRKRRLVAARRVVIEERERREGRAKLAVNRGIDEILRHADGKRLVAERDVVVSQHSSDDYNSSIDFGQSSCRRRDSARSARSRPPVWQRAQ